MTKNEIRESLTLRLVNESPIWETLKNSLVGRELLSYGVELISSFEDTQRTISQTFNYKLANSRQLISLGLAYDVPISFVKPTTITVKVKSPKGRVFRPFELKYSTGSVTFYNIDYNSDSEEITLYQGVVKFKRSDKSSVDVMEFGAKFDSDWTVKQISVDGEGGTLNGIDINTAIPESVFVVNATTKTLLSEYKPQAYAEQVNSYKKVTLFDKNLLVVPTSGSWGRTAIYWIQPTSQSFNTTKLKASWSGVGELDIEILSSVLGKEDDLEYAKETFRRIQLTQNAVCSKDQIKEYVNSLQGVLDSVVVPQNDTVRVYVKPEDSNSAQNFSYIGTYLERVGVIGTTFKVEKANPIQVTLDIKGNFTQLEKSTITDLLLNELSYDKLKIDSVFNVNKIASLVSQVVETNVEVGFEVEGINPSQKLTFIPKSGTIKLSKNGNVVGFDSNGSLYAPNNTLSILTTDLQSVGRFAVATATQSDVVTKAFVKVNNRFGDSIAIKSVIPTQYITYFPCGNLVYALDSTSDETKTINVYNTTQFNEASLLSGVDPSHIWNVKSFWGNTNLYVDDKEHAYPVLYDMETLLLAAVVDKNLVIKFFVKSSSEEYYTLAIPTEATKLVGYKLEDGDVVFYMDNLEVIRVRDIRSLSISWELGTLLEEAGTLIQYSTVDGTTAYLIENNGQRALVRPDEKKTLLIDKTGTVDKFQIVSGKAIIGDSVIDVATGETQTKSGMAILQGIDANSVVGSVNYTTGDLFYNGDSLLSYESVAVNKSTTDYLVLNLTKPIVWN